MTGRDLDRSRRRGGRGFASPSRSASRAEAPASAPVTQPSDPATDDPGLERRALELLQAGQLEPAEAIYRQLIAGGQADHISYTNLGVICGLTGRPAELLDCLRQALAIEPRHLEAWINLGRALKRNGDLDGAIAAYRMALQIRPDDADVLNNLGIALKEHGDLDAAVVAYRRAIALRPQAPQLHCNLANALKELGDLPSAIASYEDALRIDRDHDGARRNRGRALLLAGDYARGLHEYEHRLLRNQDPVPINALPGSTLWEGQPLAPQTRFLLVSEQGLGDTLQFMRYALVLRRLGLRVSLCTPSKLHGLIHASGIDPAPLHPSDATAITEGFWLPLLSLPLHLGVRPTRPILTEPYIQTSPALIDQWRAILSTESRPVIGIHWQGNPAHEVTDSQGRSLPLEAFAPIARSTTATLLSLQKGFGSEQLDGCSFRDRFVSCQPQINETWDFLETAAMIANCDLIITSDSALAHLAGGMGHPTWLLLKAVPEWRWGLQGESTFWYPSVRLFRQRRRGDWDEVMQRVARALAGIL